ncbi:MAG: hypothetical protein QM760_23580, partial [Nibricoccus sp.]
KRWFKYLVLFGVLCLLCLAAGTRIHTGQGYQDRTLTGAVRLSSSKEANRALDVVLTHRASGRTQTYGWPLHVRARTAPWPFAVTNGNSSAFTDFRRAACGGTSFNAPSKSMSRSAVATTPTTT